MRKAPCRRRGLSGRKKWPCRNSWKTGLEDITARMSRWPGLGELRGAIGPDTVILGLVPRI
ncbi:hypothetical protein AGR1A_Cc20623 [Agrobacterium fabacearum CFBP 5771]|nr:hypothetical protein AGR1A_Cc20623 [Agrobacterium fabacearum CFBP 5771]